MWNLSLADPQSRKTKTFRGYEEECPVILQQCGAVTPSRLARRPNQRHANGLRHSVEDHYALPRALGLQCFINLAECIHVVLPVVADPDISSWADDDINLHLESTSHVTAIR